MALTFKSKIFIFYSTQTEVTHNNTKNNNNNNYAASADKASAKCKEVF